MCLETELRGEGSPSTFSFISSVTLSVILSTPPPPRFLSFRSNGRRLPSRRARLKNLHRYPHPHPARRSLRKKKLPAPAAAAADPLVTCHSLPLRPQRARKTKGKGQRRRRLRRLRSLAARVRTTTTTGKRITTGTAVTGMRMDTGQVRATIREGGKPVGVWTGLRDGGGTTSPGWRVVSGCEREQLRRPGRGGFRTRSTLDACGTSTYLFFAKFCVAYDTVSLRCRGLKDCFKIWVRQPRR